MAVASLELNDEHSLKAIRWALSTAVRLHKASADYHSETSATYRDSSRQPESARHKRQAAAYTRVRDTTQRLLDQLPLCDKQDTGT